MNAKDELLEIHTMIMCPAEVTAETPAHGYTSNAVKQLILLYSSKSHPGKKPVNQVDGGLILVQRNPDKAVDLSGGLFHGWLFWRHPDGQFVSERKLEPWELMQVEDQRDEGIVLDGGSILSTKSGVRFGDHQKALARQNFRPRENRSST